MQEVKNGIYESQDHYLNCANIMLKHGLISGQEYQVYMALAQSLRSDVLTSLSYGDVEEAIQGLDDLTPCLEWKPICLKLKRMGTNAHTKSEPDGRGR